MLPPAASSGPFDLAFGLPLHPLAVHVPVVLLPLGALSVLLMLVVPRWRAQLAWPVVAVLGIAAVGSLAAKLSGEALAARVGAPGQHQELGNWLVAMAWILFAATLAWWLWQRKRRRQRRATGVTGVIVGIVLGTLAAASLIVTVLTGHTGATSVWGGLAADAAPAAAPSASASAGGSEGTGGISIGEVAQHDDSASCWVAIEGTVYDLTGWIAQHPGGPDRILGVCGTDATDEFGTQHTGQAAPAEQLSQFAIGELADR
ncbi:putative membrane protein/predicted heme/steroid binding protein [Agrococcus sp. UYP10]|uniref:cytochrome b5-like heme/steroid binding domain-containing protein n=1 Tax=Agrococcus sp. UYP10 TaxID=1756355 RepID=UPI003393F0E5